MTDVESARSKLNIIGYSHPETITSTTRDKIYKSINDQAKMKKNINGYKNSSTKKYASYGSLKPADDEDGEILSETAKQETQKYIKK